MPARTPTRSSSCSAASRRGPRPAGPDSLAGQPRFALDGGPGLSSSARPPGRYRPAVSGGSGSLWYTRAMSLSPALPRRAGASISAAILAPDRLALALIVVLAAFLELFALDREGWSNLVLRGRRPEHARGPVHVLLRSLRSGRLHHPRQAAAGLLGRGPSRPGSSATTASACSCPSALAAVASVWLIARLVGQQFGHLAGLIAALVLAVTPISVATARNNTVDSLLVLVILLAVCGAAALGAHRPRCAG